MNSQARKLINQGVATPVFTRNSFPVLSVTDSKYKKDFDGMLIKNKCIANEKSWSSHEKFKKSANDAKTLKHLKANGLEVPFKNELLYSNKWK